MYVIEKEEDLVGKTIAFTHVPMHGEQVVLATTDGGIMAIEQSGYDDDKTIIIENEYGVEILIFRGAFLREKLLEAGVITEKDINDYELKVKKREEEKIKKQLEFNEKREKEEYERLKAKFEGKNSFTK